MAEFTEPNLSDAKKLLSPPNRSLLLIELFASSFKFAFDWPITY